MARSRVRQKKQEDSTPARLDGVVIGVLLGTSEQGDPLVVFPGNPESEAVSARTTVRLEAGDVGAEVALMFVEGDPRRPLVLGRLLHPEQAVSEAVAPPGDPERLELSAAREIVLSCGKASVTLTRAGKILLRGAYIFSRSTGVNKIKGGSVQLN